MSGFILYWRDKYGTGDCILSYGHKRTLLYLWLAAQAGYEGENEGKLITSMTQLITVTLETRNKTWRWMKKLEKDGLITMSYNKKDMMFLPCNEDATTMQRPCNKPILVTISNYSEFRTVKRGDATRMQRPCNDHATNVLNSAIKTDSSCSLINNKELIINKEKKKNIIKRKKEKFEIRQDAVAAIAGDQAKFVAYAQSKTDDFAVSTAWVEREFEKWINWMDANNKTYSNYSKAFHNWILNAIQFQVERQPKRGTRLEDIPLLSADDYN